MGQVPMTIGALLALLPAVLFATAPTAEGGSCVDRLEGWEKMTDTSTVIPSFMFGSWYRRN